MIKRYNYVNRRRIPRGHVRFEVREGPPRTFSGTLDLAPFRFDPAAAVVVEVVGSGQASVHRIECGTVADLRQPADVPIEDVTARHVMFFVKVIDRSESVGRLLGLAERVRPERGGGEGGGASLLPVDVKDLDELLWRVDRRDGDNYYLELSSRVHGLEDRLRNDPYTAAMILPQALRDILADVVASVRDPAEADEEDDWRGTWVAFARRLNGGADWPGDDAESQEEYVREAVERFARRHRFASECDRLLAEVSPS